jgi:hypothetical protein
MLDDIAAAKPEWITVATCGGAHRSGQVAAEQVADALG